MSAMDPYVPAYPGGLITAELFNEIQTRIRSDIGVQLRAELEKHQKVAEAGNAGKLGGKTGEELAKEIMDRVLGEIPRRTGYKRYFKVVPLADPLEVEYVQIEHGLGAYPLVDVYQLDYFPVMCRADNESSLAWVNFYLYHDSEKRIGRPRPVQIQPSRGPVFRLPFGGLLKELGIEYDARWSLANLVGEFWEKLLNGEFDENQFCHSPWFQRCCSDSRTVQSITEAGDWDELWLKVVPRKTINYGVAGGGPTGAAVPPDVEVVHFDPDNLGVRVIPPLDPRPLYVSDERAAVDFVTPAVDSQREVDGQNLNFAQDQMKLMILLQAGAPAAGGGGAAGGPAPSGGSGGSHTHGAY